MVAKAIRKLTPANDRFRDFEIAHQIRLQGLSEAEGRKLRKILRDSDEALAARISKIGRKNTFTRARAKKLRKSIAGILAPPHSKLRKGFNAYVREQTAMELEAQGGALGRLLTPINVEYAQVSALQAVAVVRSTPMEGEVLSKWVSKLRQNDLNRSWSTIQAGITEGATNQEIARRVIGTPGLRYKDGVREVSRRGAMGLVRTTTNHVSQQARSALFEANEDIISGVQWTSTLDGRTTPICRARDGKVYPVDYGPRPPAHYNCRSTMVPVLKAWDDLPPGKTLPPGTTRASKATDFTGQVAGDKNYGQWLGERTAKFQNEVLGKTRGKLFRAGKLEMSSFVNNRGRQFTIPELRGRMPEVFAEAGL